MNFQSSKFKLVLFMIASVTIVSSFFYFSTTSSAQLDTSSAAIKPPPSENLFKRGQALYSKNCTGCHGSWGEGDGKAAYLLYPKPRDLSKGEFRLISTTDMTATDEDLFKTISRGMVGSAMPPWVDLPEKDRWSLVYYVRYLSEIGRLKRAKKITDEEIQRGLPWDKLKVLMNPAIDPEAVIKVGEEPPVTEEQLALGRQLFLKGCASCHGQLGKGDGQQEQKDNTGMPIKPRDLTSGLFKASSSSEELYFRMVGGLPGTPMPSYQYAYKPEEIWALIHYVQTLSNPQVEAKARLKANHLIAKKTKETGIENPEAPTWSSMNATWIALTPLWWRNDRIEGVNVKALHDGQQIFIYLEWADSTQNDATTAPQLFSDGVALQLSAEKDPPFFAMGSGQAAVCLWNWKAARQVDVTNRKDIETQYPNAEVDWYPSQTNYQRGCPFEVKDSKTTFHDPEFMTGWGAGNPLSNPVNPSASEEALAKGFGSLTSSKEPAENMQAQGIWKDGKWKVVFSRPLTSPGDKLNLQFRPGQEVNVAFAVWDGEKKDRNGQKMVSIWNKLVLER